MADKLEGHDAATGESIPYVEDDGAAWDAVKLGPHTLPGTWSVSGASGRRIDVKTSRGQDGARSRDRGYELALLMLTGTMVGASDWNEMVKISRILQPRKRGVAVEPLAIEHPTCIYLGITNVLVKKVFAPRLSGGQVTCSMEVLEWMPKPKKKPVAKDIPISSTDIFQGRSLRQFLTENSPSVDTVTYVGGVLP